MDSTTINAILIAVFSVTALGAILAIILCVASKLMHVQIDERVEKLTAAMPGVNCGVCGYPGCSGYAVALIADANVKANLCTPGGAELLTQISTILGVEAGSIEQKVAVVTCAGDQKARQKKMDYFGIKTCEAAKPLFGGENACAYGCLGYGDCQKVCPCKAICMEDGLARIIKELCNGCSLCVKSCPNKLISIEDAGISVFVACKNIEKGAVVRKKCTFGCIGCTKCVKECPGEAIVIENNLAKIDHQKCKLFNDKQKCGKCAEVCITKCIELARS
ncbi:MAG: RnfABCDGE type electron transport complex subunit B [Treponema sp.]|jgi:Na+-translocating ferredoxin:NAD+ oxidoreductase RNF subunit RnfB|nr:RnfABCDGE type electron transport complex subunit B [Treponema sp.]